MPQETKSMPAKAQQSLEGVVPPLNDDREIRRAIEQAFDYRGDVSIALKDGTSLEGYVFDRQVAPSTADCVFRVIPKDSDRKISVRFGDLARIAFTGRDAAAGKSFETWVKKYREKKAAGERNIRIEPEKLE
jgi:hypothetical protein